LQFCLAVAPRSARALKLKSIHTTCTHANMNPPKGKIPTWSRPSSLHSVIPRPPAADRIIPLLVLAMAALTSLRFQVAASPRGIRRSTKVPCISIASPVRPCTPFGPCPDPSYMILGGVSSLLDIFRKGVAMCGVGMMCFSWYLVVWWSDSVFDESSKTKQPASPKVRVCHLG